MNRTIKKLIFYILLAVLIAGTLPWVATRLGNLSFASNPAQARMAWTIAEFTSLYDRDTIYYNIGNSHYKERNYDEAVRFYQAADAIRQPQNLCPIRYNWALALMDKGDAATNRDDARTIYSEALRVASVNSCQDDPVYKQVFEELSAQLLARLKAANNPQNDPSQQNPTDTKKAEEAARDNEREKAAAKDYANNRRFDESQNRQGPYRFRFVW